MRLILRLFLVLRYLFHRLTGTGSFSPGHRVDFITGPHGSRANPVKAGLHHFHVKQFHESSCSVASMVSVINTLARIQGIETKITPFPLTQQRLLDQVTTAHWKERMGPDGYKGRRGLPLSVLEAVAQGCLDTFGIEHKKVEMIPAPAPNTRDARRVKQRLKTLLKKFDSTGNCILLAHFDQGSLLPEWNIPHISPVGGYDPQKDRVTILDVDPALPHPYQVSFDTFYKGISTHYQNLFRPFGYGRGGCILIHL